MPEFRPAEARAAAEQLGGGTVVGLAFLGDCIKKEALRFWQELAAEGALSLRVWQSLLTSHVARAATHLGSYSGAQRR